MHNHALSPFFKIVLVSPEIPWNVGAIGRSCVGFNLELIIIKPSLVDLSDKAVKRAGLDYWQFVKCKSYDNWETFLNVEKPHIDQLYFFSTKADKIIFEAKFQQGDYLIFGSESKGLAAFYHKNYEGKFLKLPMYSENIRSFNLANTVTATSLEVLRQINFK